MKRTKSPESKQLRHGAIEQYDYSWNRQAFELARFGMTNREMADILGISISTFELYQRKYLHFNEAIQDGRLKSSMMVVESLYKQALGYEVVETEIREGKNKRGEKVSYLTTRTKHIQPSTQAAIYLLKCRHKDKWADIVKAEVTTNERSTTKMDLSAFTTEELLIMERIGLKNLAIESKNMMTHASRN